MLVRPVLRAFREVFDEEEPALAGTDYIEIAVAVDIDHGKLHPSTHPAAIVDHMFDPLHLPRRSAGRSLRGGGHLPRRSAGRSLRGGGRARNSYQ